MRTTSRPLLFTIVVAATSIAASRHDGTGDRDRAQDLAERREHALDEARARMDQHINTMHAKRAFMHDYDGEGMEERDFSEILKVFSGFEKDDKKLDMDSVERQYYQGGEEY